jgi:lipid-A-disaccharide synthase
LIVAGPRILLSAGEPSGDLHGAALARALRSRWSDAELYGLGGPLMASAGVRLLASLDQLAVMGLVEVASRIPFFFRLLRRVRGELVSRPPDLVIPIDYPGFNLRLARAAKERNVAVLYYIAPQVWAWHRSRVGKLARYTDRMAVILPFEEALFREAGADATFVGHPLLDVEPPRRPRERFCGQVGIDADRPLLALFPGSRAQELQRHLTLFSEAARRVQARRPSIQPVIAAEPTLPDAAFAGSPWPRTRDAWELLHHASAAVVKSGTSTLQAALTVTPMVIAYRMHPASFAVAKRLVTVQHVGLANLVAGERVAPELLQDDATPESLSAAIDPLLDPAGEERRRAEAGLARVRSALSPRPADGRSVAERVSNIAVQLVGESCVTR